MYNVAISYKNAKNALYTLYTAGDRAAVITLPLAS